MSQRKPLLRKVAAHIDQVRRLAARAIRINGVDAAYFKASSSAKFGNDLAELLARQPMAALDIVNQRVVAYQLFGHLGNLTRQFKIDCVIDAGAHSGQYASTLYGYGGYKGEIHSFEPVKKYYDVLAGHLHSYPGWNGYNAALGDEAGPATIFVGRGHGGTSSLLRQTDNLKKFAADAQLGEPEEIIVHRVDEKFAPVLSDLDRRVMLKLDVQGFEERVLKSAGQFISSFKLVQIEVSGIPLYEGQCGIGPICSMMEDLGYALVLTCNSFGWNQSVFLDYDFVFCRRSELENMSA